MKQIKFLLPVGIALLLAGCGGGSSSDSSTTSLGAGNEQEQTQTQAGDLLTGRFVDSAVEGLQYATASQSGETGDDGSFSYLAGESVTFSIGDISLPAIPAGEVITPLTVFSTDEITDIQVMNLSRLLQTLDTNGDPEDGITLADAAIASATGLTVDFSVPLDAFADQVGNLVANSGSTNIELVNAIEALDHLQETLFQEGIEERPDAPPPIEEQQAGIDPNNTSSHPLVGTTAEFSDLAHDVSGTLTVVDDRTLMVSNFNYDGGGVEVFFYTGIDGDYFPSANGPIGQGVAIGPQLNGRRSTNATFMLTIPDNLTLDDFNGLSVWCVPFFANFGDAQL